MTRDAISRLAFKAVGWAIVCGTVVSLSACGSFYDPPKAWEKGLLAKPAMTMDGDPAEARFTQHILDSKEGSRGGYGVGGGGCGCN